MPLGDNYWSSTSRNITCLICHVNQKVHVIERSSDFMSGSSSLCVTTPPKFSSHRYCGSGDMFLMRRVTSLNHFFKWHVGKFGSFGHCCSGDITFLICNMIQITWLKGFFCFFLFGFSFTIIFNSSLRPPPASQTFRH